jgi:hypothetical protein
MRIHIDDSQAHLVLTPGAKDDFFAVGRNRRQLAEAQAFAAVQPKRSGNPQVPRPDPMSPEAEPARLSAMQHDIGLTDAEMVKVKSMTDNSVKEYQEFHKSTIDPQQARAKTIAMHQKKATAIMAVLTREEQPKFQAWRDAQLLGMQMTLGGRRTPAGTQVQGGPLGQGSPQEKSGPPGQRWPQRGEKRPRWT